jgi:probable HAF family extracellular repeat protein
MTKHTPPPTRILAAAATSVLAALALAGGASADSETSGDPVSGFLLDRGRYQSIDLPGDGVGSTGISTLTGLNNRGRIVGKAVDRDDEGFYGLVGDRRGRFRRIDYPGAMATYANKIDDRGRIVGDANLTVPRIVVPGTFGYLLERGRFSRIAYPGAIYTRALGINNRGQVVGEYLDQDGVFHGYRWKNGRFETFDGPLGNGASISDINDRGDMVGVYLLDPANVLAGVRGFLLRNGRYTTFSALDFLGTFPFDINNRGQIAGFATSDPNAAEVHGFLLAKGIDRPATQIDVPGAASTAATGLDDRGRIVGFYDFRRGAPPSAQHRRAAATVGLLPGVPRAGATK